MLTPLFFAQALCVVSRTCNDASVRRTRNEDLNDDCQLFMVNTKLSYQWKIMMTLKDSDAKKNEICTELSSEFLTIRTL